MGIPYAVGQVLILVSVGASAKQTGLIPSWLAQAGYVSALGALIPHEVTFTGVVLAMVWMLVAATIMFRGASTSASAQGRRRQDGEHPAERVGRHVRPVSVASSGREARPRRLTGRKTRTIPPG